MNVRYERLARLGAGSFGEVWRARDRERGVEVAVKTFFRAEDARGEALEALATIEHPGLVRLLDRGDGFHVMELVEGSDLIAFVRRPRAPAKVLRATLPLAFGQPVQEGNVSAFAPADVDEVAKIRRCFAQLASAVRALHRSGLVHGDLKPSNTLVTPEGRLVVVDYGLAAPIGGAPTSSFAGAPAYMAPEQGRSIEAANDAYAIGVMLFEALAGALPFDGSAQEVMTKKGSVSAPRASFVVTLPRGTEDLDALCERLLRREPSMRPTDDELVRALG